MDVSLKSRAMPSFRPTQRTGLRIAQEPLDCVRFGPGGVRAIWVSERDRFGRWLTQVNAITLQRQRVIGHTGQQNVWFSDVRVNRNLATLTETSETTPSTRYAITLTFKMQGWNIDSRNKAEQFYRSKQAIFIVADFAGRYWLVGEEGGCKVTTAAATEAKDGESGIVLTATCTQRYPLRQVVSSYIEQYVTTPVGCLCDLDFSEFCALTYEQFCGLSTTCYIPRPSAPTGLEAQQRVEDGDLTWTVDTPPAGIEIQWALDPAFATIVATGTSYTRFTTKTESPITVYVRAYDPIFESFSLTVTAQGLVSAFSFGNAIALDGVNDYLVANPAMPSIGINDFSFIWWMKVSSLASLNGKDIFARGQLGSSGYEGRFGPNSLVWVHLAASQITTLFIPLITLPIGQWAMMAITCERSGLVRGYINGIQVASVANLTTASITDAAFGGGMYIGARNPGLGGLSLYFPGRIDEVQLYYRLVSGTEILALYNAGQGLSPENTTGLVARYSFDTRTGVLPTINVPDLSGNGNNITGFNFATEPLQPH